MDLVPTRPWVHLLTCTTRATVLPGDQVRESRHMDMDILDIRDRDLDMEVLVDLMDLVPMVRGQVDLLALVNTLAILLTQDLVSIQDGMDPMLLLAKEVLLLPDRLEVSLQVILA